MSPDRASGPTRRRIVEAALELCATAGPATLTVSAVAERARVQRLTVYRQVGDAAALLAACQERIETEPSRPDPTAWEVWPDPVDRLLVALEAIFAHYRATGPLLGKALGDETANPATARLTAPYHAMVERAVDTLAAGWTGDPSRSAAVRAALRLVVAFETWRSLIGESGLAEADAIDVLVGAVEAAAEPYA